MLAEGAPRLCRVRFRAARPDVVVLYEDNFNFLTKMCLARMREAACRMIGEARAAGARVIVAGSDASDHPAAFLCAGAHAVLQGEGIAALTELIQRLDRNPSVDPGEWAAAPRRRGDAGGQAGAAAANRCATTDPALAIRPAWDLVDIERYRTMWQERHGYFSLNMAASRGCPFRCNWCAKPIWGNHYRQISALEMATQMAAAEGGLRAGSHLDGR